MVFQNYALYPHMTVYKNMAFALKLRKTPREEIDRLFAADAELADWGRRMAEEQLRRHEEYFADFAWRDKSEQYKRVLREYPQLLQRIALKDLAAYLFVTPQSLSRIRAEIK